jgi:hypothetical protein
MTWMAEYPKRDSHHAHKLTRLLFKSCACQSIGHHAALLVIHIAHTEDAARYQYPVRFWNGQLMNAMGWTSPKQLSDARRKAVDGGWLHYERDSDRTVGRYWTLIPESVTAFNDEPIEPCFISYNGMDIHSQSGTGNGKHSPGGTGSGMESGTGSGKPSTLSLLHTLPRSLQTEDFSIAWSDWIEHVTHVRGQRPSDQNIEAMLMECTRRGADVSIRDIRFSIKVNAKNLCDGSKRFDERLKPNPEVVDNMPPKFDEFKRLASQGGRNAH